MYGRGFGRRGRGGFGAYGPGYGRGAWRAPAWEAEAWGGPPTWARRWGIDLPASERKAWLEQAKAHLQARLEEIEKELQALSSDQEA